jgi:drug/metabolite transporter (DMT)-like permease
MGTAPTVLARFRNLPASWRGGGLWFGWTMAVIATLSFSVAAPIAKAAMTGGMDPNILLAMRLTLAAILLGGTLGLANPVQLRMDGRGTRISLLAGTANGFGMVFFFLGLSRLPASITAMIFSLSPLAVLALLALRGEKFTYRQIIRLSLGIGGVYLLVGPDGAAGNIDWLGVFFVLGTVLLAAVHMSLLQWFLTDYPSRSVTLYVVSMMAAVSAGLWLVQGTPWENPGRFGWLAVILLAVVSTYISRLSLFAAVRSLGSGQMALLLPAETLLTVVWSVLFLGERLTLWQWLGGILILSSAVLAINRLRWTGRRLRLRNWSRP